MRRYRLPPTDFWYWSNAFFPPRATRSPSAQPASSFAYPVYNPTTRPEALPVRTERHNPHSIATLRRQIATHLARSLPRCPCCLRGFLCGVEVWRGGLGSAYPLPALSFAGASLTEPCSVSTPRSSTRTCATNASGSRRKGHVFAHGKLRVRSLSRTKPRTSWRDASGNLFIAGHGT